MRGLLFLVCALGVILQIVSIGKLKKSKDSKYWNLFVGTNAAIFISVVIAYLAFMEDETLDLGGALVCMFFSGLTILVNVIMLIIGLVQKKKVKYYYFKLNISFPICWTIYHRQRGMHPFSDDRAVAWA